MDKLLTGGTQTDPDLDGFVRVRGAREHNLKNVDLKIPRNALVVFTGVSGSGKSSLAFGTLYAEAQRRYFDSVSPWINDRYEFTDVERWFRERGFVEVERRADEMDHYVVGRRPG